MTLRGRGASDASVLGVRRHVSWAEGTHAPAGSRGAPPHQAQQQPSSGAAFVDDLHDQLIQAVGPYVHAYLSLPPGVNPLLPHVSGGPPRPPPPPQALPPTPEGGADGALGVHLTPRFLVYGEDLRTWAASVTAPEPLPAGETIIL
jgi:hypothetical protein